MSVGRRIFEVVIMGVSMAIYHALFLDMWMAMFPTPGVFEVTLGYIAVGLVSLGVANAIIWSLKREGKAEGRGEQP